MCCEQFDNTLLFPVGLVIKDPKDKTKAKVYFKDQSKDWTEFLQKEMTARAVDGESIPA